MKKIVIIATYIFIFWVLLPFFLLYTALLLDDRCAFSLSTSVLTILSGIFFIVISIPLLVISIIQFKKQGKELPISATPAAHLIQNGLFAVWRHPIYLFFTLTFIGIALILPSFSLLVIVIPFFILVELFYIYIEEMNLIKRFGDPYRYYKKQTPLVIPAFHNILRLHVYFLLKIFFSYRVTGKENIPAQPPFFVLAAHKNYLDPFFIAAAISFPVQFITTHEVFRNPFSRLFFRRLNCLAKKRYTTDHTAIRSIIRAIEHNQVIGIFPEGERSWTGRTVPFKSEVLNLLRKYHRVPILPVQITGNYIAWPRWAKWPRRAPVHIHFQKPIFIKTEQSLDETERQLRTLTECTDISVHCRSKQRAKNISLVIYRCPVCRTFEPYNLKNGIGFICRYCQTNFDLRDDYTIQYIHNGNIMKRNIEQVYQQIRINADGDLQNNDGKENLTIIRSGDAAMYMEQKNRLVRQFNCQLILNRGQIRFQNQDQGIYIDLNKISSLTIEGNDKLQIYIRQDSELFQVIFKQESALKWQDYIIEVMKTEIGRTPNSR